MIITKIERQKKNKTRYSIFVDDKYAFSVSEDVYVRFALHSGQELTDIERIQIENAEAESSVRRVALRYRSYRPRSRNEILEYLRKKGFDDSHIHLAIVFLDEMKLLNDDEFARMFCRDRLQLKPVGKSSMKHLLYKKGIDKLTVERERFSTFSRSVRIRSNSLAISVWWTSLNANVRNPIENIIIMKIQFFST